VIWNTIRDAPARHERLAFKGFGSLGTTDGFSAQKGDKLGLADAAAALHATLSPQSARRRGLKNREEAMYATQDDIARHAAQRLSAEFGEGLPAAVETQIHVVGDAPQRYEPATIIAVATLLLNVTKFAWDIYRDRKRDAKPVDANSIARTIRVELTAKSAFPEGQRDKVIGAVVEELLKAPPSS
jgi:hypothetical protein